LDNKALEKRITALEAKIAQMEERRSRIVPPELDADPNIVALMQDRLRNAVDTWKSCLAADGVRIKEARIRDMEAQALRELEAQGKSAKQRQEAEVFAVLQYLEKHGELPPDCGYELEDDGWAAINNKVF
jgi:hypothetical protein